MALDLDFVYYRNFRFDGKFHVRCAGDDLAKLDRIRYELYRQTAEGPVHVEGVSVRAQASSGNLVDYGCPATLTCKASPGTYRIHPRAILQDRHALANGLPPGPSGVIELAPLEMTIAADELTRNLLDKVPLQGATRRRKRALQAPHRQVTDPFAALQPSLPRVAPGEQYPPLLIRFSTGGLQQFLQDLQPGSGSLLGRNWPDLIDPQPLLTPEEQEDGMLEVLARYCTISQPPGMPNEAFVELLKTLAALDYVTALDFAKPEAPPGFLLFGALAVLMTGGAIWAAGAQKEENRPTPDFEAMQHYLDAPDARWQGLNIRPVWAGKVTGKGARIHFTDGGLFPGHEDLRGNSRLKVVSSQPNSAPDHGTASVGVMLAMRNGFGMTGVSHDSELFLHDNRAADGKRGVQTLKDLLRLVEPGDVVGINRQTANPSDLYTFLPSLHDWLWWDACQALVNRGAVVINAASNGSNLTDAAKGTVAGQGVDLSQWPLFVDHGDAGCILVGACQSWDGKPHRYSNHGYRYRMLNAWGDSVATLSYGKLQDKEGADRDYTDNYGGTSAATPLVTGALSLIQSYAIEQHHLYLNSDQMHLLVMASGYEDATQPGTDVLPMGARPNVLGALQLLDQIVGQGRFPR